jgi:hypothetical protein
MNRKKIAIESFSRLVCTAALLSAGPVFFLPAAGAQNLTGTITATVHDQSGAVVPGAHVTLTNEKSGDVRTATSGASGEFVITAVQPAEYSVEVTAAGFTSWKENDIVMSVGDTRSIPNIKLAVGSNSEKVTVVGGGAAVVPTDTAEISTTLNEKMINSFPMQGRDAGELLKIMPGMALNTGNGASGFQDKAIGSNAGPVGDYSSNGTQPNGTMAYMLDGADLVDPGNFGTQIANINPDMVGSIKMQMSNYSAEYAKGPSIFQAFSRSGGRDFHGEAYFYTHNAALNSVDAYTKAQGGTNAAQSYYYMGGNIGGPVILPFTHFNHDRNKLFFWGGYEYMKQQPAGSILNYNVPNAAQLAGDFSNPGISAAAITQWPDFYNQLTQNVPAGGSATSLPAADLDPNMKAIIALYPKTNQTPTAANGYTNYNYVNTSPVNRWEASGKLDYAISDNTKLTGSYTYQREGDLAPISIWWAQPNTLPYPTPGAANTVTYVINTNLTHVFNATTTNETVFSISHFVNPYSLADPNAVDRTKLGFNVQGLFGHTTSQIPNIYPGYCCSEDIGSFNYYPVDGSFGGIKEVPAVYDNFTKVFGTHTVKAGFYWDDSRNSQSSNAADNGSYEFAGNQFSSGNTVADMMEGIVAQYSQQNADYPTNTHFHQVSGFAQDSWRAQSNLTVNFGMRFDHIGQWTAIGSPDPGFQVFSGSNLAANPTANNAGLLWHATDSSIPTSGFKTPLFYYAPRVGFAYDIFGTGKTVVRGGFGVYRYQATSETASAESGPLGSFNYGTPQPFVGVANNITFTPPSAVAQNGATVDAMQLGDDRSPFTNDYNFTIDQALPGRSVLEVAYVGNRSGDEYMDGTNSNLFNLNNIPVGGIFHPDPVTGNYVSPASPACSTASAAAESLYCEQNAYLYSRTYTVNDFRPIQTYQNIYLLTHAPYSYYNGLQISFNKETGPFTFVTNYTFSKVLGIRDGGSNNGAGNGSGVDPFVLGNNYGPLAYDHTHILNFVYNYTFPKLINAQSFGTHILAGAVNGWQVSGYTAFQTGSPMQPNSGGDLNAEYPTNLTVPTVAHPNLPDNSITLPNGLKAIAVSPSTWFGSSAYNVLVPVVTCNPTKNLKSGQRFNPACFAPPTQGQIGTEDFPYIREPNYFDTDLGIYKDFHITESRYVQIRVSATNWLNHPLSQFNLTGNNSDDQLNFISTTNATCAGCTNTDGSPIQVQSLSQTNTNPLTTGKPEFKTGSRFVTMAAKFYF